MAKLSGLQAAVKDTVRDSLRVPKNTGEWKRIVLWSMWTINMILNFVYIVLTFATNAALVQSYIKLNISIHNSAWRAPIASTAIGGVMVLMFNIMSCVILIRKSINRSGPGFGYGFIVAWCFVMSFMCLLCGIVSSGFTDTVEKELQKAGMGWSKTDTGVYNGATALAFVCAAFYILFFASLVIFQGGIMKTTGLYDIKQDEKRKAELRAAAAVNPMSSSTGPQI